MPSKLLSSITGGGGSAGVNLAPDLTFPSSINAEAGVVSATGIDASSGLTEILSVTGKFIVDYMYLSALTAENLTVKLTVDGVVVWNSTFTSGTELALLGGHNGISLGHGPSSSASILCNSSLVLEVQTATDTSISFSYLARPIL